MKENDDICGLPGADKIPHPIHWSDVLRAEAYGTDLQEDEQGNIVVCAMRHDMSLYELGRVSGTMAYQNPEAAHYAIKRIKFAARAPLMATQPNVDVSGEKNFTG